MLNRSAVITQAQIRRTAISPANNRPQSLCARDPLRVTRGMTPTRTAAKPVAMWTMRKGRNKGMGPAVPGLAQPHHHPGTNGGGQGRSAQIRASTDGPDRHSWNLTVSGGVASARARSNTSGPISDGWGRTDGSSPG